MRSSSRAAALAPVSLLSLAVASACFADPPGSSSDTATGSTSAADTTSASSPSTGTITESSASTSTSEGEPDSSATMVSEVSSLESGSTGDEPPECGCPEPNVFCDGFEAFPGPWATNPDGGGITMQDMEAPRCGLAAAYAHVEIDDTYANLQAPAGETGAELTSKPYSLRAFVHVRPECTEAGAFVRVLELRFEKQEGLWYRWVVAVQGGQLRLSAANEFAASADWLADAPLPDTWAELRLDFDFGTESPSAQLYVDGASVIATDVQAPPISDGAFTEATPPTIMLGPFFYDAPFTTACTAYYDEVSVALP